MKTLVLDFARDKQTPNKVRFAIVETDESVNVGPLYVPLDVAHGVTAVRVTIEDVSSERDGSQERKIS